MTVAGGYVRIVAAAPTETDQATRVDLSDTGPTTPSSALAPGVVGHGLAVGRPGSMSALVAVTVLFAVELLRAFPALLPLHLGGVVAPEALALLQVTPFLAAPLVLIGACRRDPRALFVAAALLLVVARVGVQMSDGPAAVGLAGIGLAAALCVLAVLVTLGLPLLGGGVLAGVVLDAALHTGLASRHLVWVESWWALAVVVGLASWYLWLVASRARRPMFVLGRSLRSAWSLMLVGPVLVLEGFMLVNLGWLGQVTTLGWLGASLVGAAGAGLGLVASALTARHPSAPWPVLGAVGAGAVLVLPLAGLVPGVGWIAAVLLAQAAIGSVLTTAGVRGAGTGDVPVPMAVISVGYVAALGSVALLDGRGILGLAVPPAVALVATAVAMFVAVVLARTDLVPRPHRPGRTELSSLLGVFVIPAALVVAGVPVLVQPGAAVATGAEVRVVTYNVGLAFDLDGGLNLDEVASTLEGLSPDVVSLQEVPRGHLPTGGVDMVGWLQRRLAMPHVVFQPSSVDALHGNAILSRFPIDGVRQHRFDRVGTALPRGALAVELDVGGGDPLVVVGTHLPPGGTLGERASRVDAILDLWGDRPRTVIAGDLNSQPGSDILTRLDGAGLVPAWDPAEGPGHTYPAAAPRARIDWVLHTGDLTRAETTVVDSVASDHRPLLAVLELG
ncbi:MAG: endonuclease/exonuclease/phosphatase family protein [Acidimicrobiales bacterium]